MAAKVNKSKAIRKPNKKAGKLRIPVEFEVALTAFLNVPPPPKPAKKSVATKKRAAKKR